MNEITYIICLPIIAGIFLFLIPEKLKTFKGIIAGIVSVYTLYLSIMVFKGQTGLFNLEDLNCLGSKYALISGSINDAAKYITFNIDNLSQLIILFVNIFAFLIILYSIIYISKEKKVFNYYSFFLITLGLSCGTALADNMLLLLIFWGALGLTLYKLIKGHDEESSATAK